jgi:protein involved in polysaccharide export with SLBB domain
MPTRFSALRAAALLALCLLAGPARVTAQLPGPAYATRERLEQELSRLEADGHSSVGAALIRARLQSGDFQAGDRIFLRVEGEPQLTDTFTVGPGPELALPQIGAVPLSGVLRAELQQRLEGYLARYIRDPVVQIRPLIRVLVEGEVMRPGFYGVAPQQPVADVITAAGGFTQRSRPTGMRVERDRTTIWGGASLQQALSRGDSFDYLNLRAGDRLLVPARGDFARTAGIIGALVAIPVAIYSITRHR